MSTRRGKMANLSRALDSHVRSIEEMFQMLEKSVASSLEKVEWSQVINLSEEVSKQATITGMLFNGETPEIKQLEENMEAYFNVLHGFILLCHGSTVGAGPTLHASICGSARQVIDCSLALLKEAASSCESPNSSKQSSIPRLSGSVWEACANLKKAPTANCTAIGRAITSVAVSVKDVVREMHELKPATTSTDSAVASPDEDDSGDELGNDLSPEEMVIAQLAAEAVSDLLTVLKEVIRFVSGLLRTSNAEGKDDVDALERMLICCQEIGTQGNELGASVYPPQEISSMKSSAKKICSAIDEMMKAIGITGGLSQSLLASFEGLKISLKKMETGLGASMPCEVQKLAI
ncbi:hypothetical protein AXF42_Ash002258 [Apostasia shenzhenica]|uniref:Cyclin-D1-binding protein 1 n=1 Tax=Apostasia shenzhenica TaxID=1088818 RepID=A0A2I0AN50_9ASPA|nr:hypothetical protein AXF42_Ash002258 [Apostasia shenzhenica]